MSGALCVAVVKGIHWAPPVDLHLTICSVEPGQDCPPCDLALVTLPVLQQAHSAFTAAKMLFVLLPDNASIRELWTLQGVVGFGRAADPLTMQEIQRVVEALHERERLQEAEQEGTVTIQESAVLPGSPFASHFRGEMRRFYQELQDLLLSIRPLEPTEFQYPFRGPSPSQWLDFYGHRKSGAFLRPEAARETWEAIQGKIGTKKTSEEKGEQAFEEIFYRERNGQAPEPLLLLGETGVGKTVVAQMLYRRLIEKAPPKAAYVPPLTQINCAGLGNLLESELFGAMTGAYTGADITNPGKIIASYGGIVFLDEIGAMSKKAQEKLLVYLDRGEVSPEGWRERPLRVPVRIIAATNANLLDEVQNEKFRLDLYYRFERRLLIPPLRERGPEDLELLMHDFLSSDTPDAINPRLEDGGRTVQYVSGTAWTKLKQYDYAGNVRELRNVLREGIKKAARMRSRVILTSDVEFEKSPLPQQHSVLALIKAQHEGQEWFLLRFNPNWYNYFLIGGRFEANRQTYENALQEELRVKLGLEPAQYELCPYTGGAVRMIQYSDRDKKLKHYTFHLYGVIFKEDPWIGKDLKKLGLLWVTHEHIQQERGPAGEKISPTIKELAVRANSFADFSSSPLHVG